MSAIELREKATRIYMQARDLIKSISEASDEARAKEIDTQVDRMLAEADALEARATKLDKIEAAERAINVEDPRRPNTTVNSNASQNAFSEERHAEAFYRMFRGQALSEEHRAILNQRRDAEKRDFAEGTNTSGGYFVPTTLSDQIIQSMKAYGPMMDPDAFNQFRTTSGNPYNFDTVNDTANLGRLVTEAAAINSATLPTLGQITLNAYKYTSDFFKVSSELLQDSAIDLPGLITQQISTRLGRVLNNHLTVGTGSAQPQGIMTGVGTPSLSTVANASIAYGDVIELIHSVDPAYRTGPKVRLMFSDNIFKALRKLTDTQNHPLWNPAVKDGPVATFAGYEYLINQDMPTLASGNVGMLFGDMSKYTVRVSRDITVKFTDQRFIDNDQVAWVAFVRLDGHLMDPGAIKGLKIT